MSDMQMRYLVSSTMNGKMYPVQPTGNGDQQLELPREQTTANLIREIKKLNDENEDLKNDLQEAYQFGMMAEARVNEHEAEIRRLQNQVKSLTLFQDQKREIAMTRQRVEDAESRVISLTARCQEQAAELSHLRYSYGALQQGYMVLQQLFEYQADKATRLVVANDLMRSPVVAPAFTDRERQLRSRLPPLNMQVPSTRELVAGVNVPQEVVNPSIPANPPIVRPPPSPLHGHLGAYPAFHDYADVPIPPTMNESRIRELEGVVTEKSKLVEQIRRTHNEEVVRFCGLEETLRQELAQKNRVLEDMIIWINLRQSRREEYLIEILNKKVGQSRRLLEGAVKNSNDYIQQLRPAST